MIDKTISKFLSEETPSVLCIKGGWGTGKTHQWKESVEEHGIENSKYIYISAFGINSIKDFEKKIALGVLDQEAEKAESKTKTYIKKISKIFKKQEEGSQEANKRTSRLSFINKMKDSNPLAKKMIGDTLIELAISGGALNNSLVCIDDIERKGIPLLDMFGFIDNLKNKHNCRVVMIFNETELLNNDEDDKRIISSYREKVIDIEVEIPSPILKIVAEIKLSESEKNIVRQLIEKTGMKNIRIIEKSLPIYEELKSILKENSMVKTIDMDDILNKVLTLSYIHYEPLEEKELNKKIDPEIEHHGSDKKNIEELFMKKIGHIENEMDQPIRERLRTGYFKEETIEQIALNRGRIIENIEYGRLIEKLNYDIRYNFNKNQKEINHQIDSFIETNIKKTSMTAIKEFNELEFRQGDVNFFDMKAEYDLKNRAENITADYLKYEISEGTKTKILDLLDSRVEKKTESRFHVIEGSIRHIYDDRKGYEKLCNVSTDTYHEWFLSNPDSDLLSELTNITYKMKEHKNIILALEKLDDGSPLSSYRMDKINPNFRHQLKELEKEATTP